MLIRPNSRTTIQRAEKTGACDWGLHPGSRLVVDVFRDLPIPVGVDGLKIAQLNH